MYGPKLDFMATDSLGREHQVATIQLDLNQPERFDLYCINEKGEKERVVMIHAAIMGSIERFSAVLLEHINGILPLWLAPVQVRVLPVSEPHQAYATALVDRMKKAGIRAETDLGNESLGKRIRACKLEKLPAYIVVGDQEVSSQTVGLERHDGTKTSLTEDALITQLLADIRTRVTA
jgi:threonyl-tRNA synthetase